MSPRMPFDSGLASGIAAAVLLVLFAGICVWAYSARRRPRYDAAAQLPLEEDASGDGRGQEPAVRSRQGAGDAR